jgi:hypothetical protein
MKAWQSMVLTLWLCAPGFLLAASDSATPSAQSERRNVILITIDGVRSQEIFGGLDETIAVHDAQQVYSEIAEVRSRYPGGTGGQRRAALMPNLWNLLAPQGQIFGNAALGNHVKVQNQVLWSTPGYVEIMTGAPREVRDNEARRYPWPTAMEVAKKELGLDYQQVAQIGSWTGYSLAAASQDDAFLMVGTFDKVPAPFSTPELDKLAGLRSEVMGLWSEGSDDVLTFRMAHGYLQTQQPRLLWIALVNSDDWAHADRYDRYLDYLHRVDGLIGELWQTVQSTDAYRDKTTLIITTDHGRGLQGSDWIEHDISIPGSADIWLAVIGPDTPDVGEVTTLGTLYQGQVAATLLYYLGLDHHSLDSKALPPVSVYSPIGEPR